MTSIGPIGAIVKIKRVSDNKTVTLPSFIACSRFLVKSKPYALTRYKLGKPLKDAFGEQWEFIQVIEPKKRPREKLKPADAEKPKLNTFYETTQIAAELMKKPPGKWTHEIQNAAGEIELARFEQKVHVLSGIEIVFYRTLDGVKSLHTEIWDKRSKPLRKSKRVVEETEE